MVCGEALSKPHVVLSSASRWEGDLWSSAPTRLNEEGVSPGREVRAVCGQWTREGEQNDQAPGNAFRPYMGDEFP